MELLDIIKGRRSIRRFKDMEIPPDAIEALKEALIWAPSAGNLQSRRFYFVFNKEIKASIAGAALRQTFMADAPLVIVACIDEGIGRYYGERGISLYAVQDVAVSIQNLMLLAHSLGLGSVWVGAFNDDEVSRILELPPNQRPVAIVPVGYPDEAPSPPPRLPKRKVVKEVR